MTVIIMWRVLSYCLIAASVCCAAKLHDQPYYHDKSRSSYQKAIDEAVKPHLEALNGARAKLSEIFDDASSQGVQCVKFYSKLSETGFLALAYLSAGKRFESFASQISNLDKTQFGKQFADHNSKLIVGFDRESDKIACTFHEVMHSGKCTKNGKSFDVTDFTLVHNSRTYEFRTLKDLSIEESEENIYRNLHLTSEDAYTYRNLPEATMREYLYDHLGASKMFHFLVQFDNVEQPKYFARGQGEQLSKVLHFELAFNQLYYELIARQFTIASTSHDGTTQMDAPPHIATNATEFKDYPSEFAQEYNNPRGMLHSFVTVLKQQGMEVCLWSEVKDDFLAAAKRTESWRTAGQRK